MKSCLLRKLYKLIFATLMAVFIFFPQRSLRAEGDASMKKIKAVKLTEKIAIDGKLDESVWHREGFSELFQQEPHPADVATQKTEFWVAYDKDAIYYAARYYDPHPDSILARLVRRDFVWGDPSDGTVLYLDSYGDKRNGYFFYVNAAGTLADGLLENDSKQTDLSWDAVWEGVPHIDELGWTVEIRVPYSQLRFKEEDVQVWGINVERYISRKAETDMVAYTPRGENGFASRFPQLIGIEGIHNNARVELLPYVTAKAEYVGHDSENPFNPGHRYRAGAGLDLRAGLGSSLTLNATINPDFGQVELDPANVNLTDVETSFQEKRPFFTEGVNIYRFGRGGANNFMSFNWPTTNIFYSRRIGRTPQGGVPENDYADIPNGTHILGAAKVSGRVKNWKIGTLHAVTEREFAKIELEGEQSKAEVEPASYYSILRLQRDFNEGKQGLGILSTFANRFFKDSTLRNIINHDALVTGVDGWTFLDNKRTYVLTGWAATSRVSGDENRMIALQRSSLHYFQRPDVDYLGVDTITSMVGSAGRIMLNKNRGKFQINTAVGWLSPKFEVNDMGYGSYSDLINMHFSASYRILKPTKYYQTAGFNTGTYLNSDFGGNKTAQGYMLGTYLTLKDLSGASIYYSLNAEAYNARLTRGGPLTLNPRSQSVGIDLNSDNRKWWVAYFGYNTTWDGSTDAQEIALGLEFKISTSLTIQAWPSISNSKFKAQWVTAYTDAQSTDTYGRRYVFANLRQKVFATEFRADWIITPKLSFQVYAQPYIVSGKYENFKALAAPKTFDFMQFGENGSTLTKILNDDGSIASYILDADGDGPAIARTIGNPDFNYVSLRGNAVLRWEYRPGSALFLVWNQTREEIEPSGDYSYNHSFRSLADTKADNIFMLKASFWF